MELENILEAGKNEEISYWSLKYPSFNSLF
jgi:hypothetical protein